MAIHASTIVLDEPLEFLQANTQVMCINTSQPVTSAEAISTTSTSMMSRTTTLASTDFTIADSSASGRKITIAAFSTQIVSSSGTATHVSLVNATSSKLLFTTICGTKSLTTADVVNYPSWRIHYLQATSST